MRGTSGDDTIHVTPGDSGGLNVHVNGQQHRLSRQDVDRGVTIQGADGNDRILVSHGVRRGIRLEGGAGNDDITGGDGHDLIDGGAGNDRLNGGAGNDRVYGRAGADQLRGSAGDDYLVGGTGNDTIDGGEHNDTIYGLDGNDRVNGGEGRDYLDGGAGNDHVSGGEGNDQLLGGRGNDVLRGDNGADVLAGGEGRDQYNGGGGRDNLYAQRNDQNLHRDRGDVVREVAMDGSRPGNSIAVEDRSEGQAGIGSADPDFRAQVESDLDALRSLPEGRALLTDIDANAQRGNRVTVRETAVNRDRAPNPEYNATWRGRSALAFEDGQGHRYQQQNGSAGRGVSSRVLYDQGSVVQGRGTAAHERRPPIVALAHELGHGRDAGAGRYLRGETREPGATDTRPTPNFELSNVGLPHDHDSNPSTPPRRPAAEQFTENALRRRLGIPERTRYRR